MSYSVGYPVNFTSGGDKTNQAIQKFINEFTRLYGYLNTEAAKIPADASGLDVTDAGGYFTAENIEGILQEIGALLATLGDLATEDVIDEDLLSLSDVTTGDASAEKHGFLPKLPDDSGKALLGDGSWGSVASNQYICIKDVKASGTNGGSVTANSWLTRTLNTIQTDQTGEVTLASNAFTLPAGTYIIHAEAPARQVGGHKARLYNVTDAASVLEGTARNTWDSAVVEPSTIAGLFTLAASKELRIEHHCGENRTSIGFGVAYSHGDEVYTVVELWKVA